MVGRTVNSSQLLPAIRDLCSRRPEYFHHEPWELAHVLFPPGLAESWPSARNRGEVSVLFGVEYGIPFDQSNTKKGAVISPSNTPNVKTIFKFGGMGSLF
jgi:hypothetical protein